MNWDEVTNMSQLSRDTGIPAHVIRQRKRAGWTVERTISTPVRKFATSPGVRKKAAPKKVAPKKVEAPKVEAPLVTPDKDIGWVWVAAVGVLVGLAVVVAREAGVL
jgi:hypothetical protein